MHSSKSLVLIVGAGASKEAGLPMGSELKAQIAEALQFHYEHGHRSRGDGLIEEALRVLLNKREERDINPYIHAARMISRAMPQAPSIDNYIDAHRDNNLIEECGKLAIARCILQAETNSAMWFSRRNSYNDIDFKRLETTWYNAFFQQIVLGCRTGDIAEKLSKVAIITFNYDRCIEHFLHRSLCNYYGIGEDDAAALMENLCVYHPYGDLGAMTWASVRDGVDFGLDPNAHQLLEISSRLKTFTEGTDKTHSDIVEIRQLLAKTERVAYLGFAFNPQNMDLLYGPRTAVKPAKSSVFGTAYGLSDSDVGIIKQELVARGGYKLDNVKLDRELKCAGLFQEFGRSLAIR